MKEALAETRPLVLDALLKISANFHVVTEWVPVSQSKARKEVTKRRRHFNISKTGFVSQLGNDTTKTNPRDVCQESSLPYVDVEVKNVILEDLRQSPYSARIEFEKVFTNPADHSEIKRERWTASVTYVFRENVKNNELAVNPLGLTIVRFRADQAFS
jgi:hypothetical protein